MKPKDVRNANFLSIAYNKPLKEYRKRNFKIRDRVRISEYDLPFRRGWSFLVFPCYGNVCKQIPEVIWPRKNRVGSFLVEDCLVSSTSCLHALYFSISRQLFFLCKSVFHCSLPGTSNNFIDMVALPAKVGNFACGETHVKRPLM